MTKFGKLEIVSLAMALAIVINAGSAVMAMIATHRANQRVAVLTEQLHWMRTNNRVVLDFPKTNYSLSLTGTIWSEAPIWPLDVPPSGDTRFQKP